MKKHDLGIIVAGLMFLGVGYSVLSVVVGFTPYAVVYGATFLAVLGWVLLIAAVVVNFWSSVDSFKQY